MRGATEPGRVGVVAADDALLTPLEALEEDENPRLVPGLGGVLATPRVTGFEALLGLSRLSSSRSFSTS